MPEKKASHKKRDQELCSDERHLRLLNNIINSIIASDDYELMMKKLVRDLADLLEADDCYLARWQPSGRPVSLAAATQKFKPYSDEQAFSPQEEALVISALDKRKVLVLKQSDPLAANLEVICKHSEKCTLLVIPLIYSEMKIGTAILTYGQGKEIEKEDRLCAGQVGQQIALMLCDAQQDYELQKRLRETNTLANIARNLSETEHVGLRSVLQLIVASVKELIPKADQTVIHILDEDGEYLVPEAVSWLNGKIDNTVRMRLGEGIAGQVLSNGATIKVADVFTDERFLKTDMPPKFRSMIVAPVQSGSQKLGTISIWNNLPNAFTQDECDLLSALGIQAANACLLELTKTSQKETNALYRISQGLVAAIDPEQLMNDVVELLKENFGYYHVQIYVADPESGDFYVRAGSGEIGRKLVEMKHHLAVGEGFVGYTAETGMPFFTNTVEDSVSFVANPLLPETKSELAVPIKVGNRMLGLLDVQQKPPSVLTSRDMHLMSAVADQLAVALQKANLYADLQTALHQEQETRSQLIHSERLAVVGRLLASVSHELNNPLQAIQNALFLLKEEIGISEQGRQDLNIVLSETERMASLLERLRVAYRTVKVEDFQLIQFNDIIEDIAALVATHLRHNKIIFEFHPDPNLPRVSGLDEQLRQVMLNLFVNAVDAMSSGGRLRVFTDYDKKHKEVVITISDTGVGIEPAILPNVFEAFVTNKERGSGLGLTITYEIVAKHNGRIKAENNKGPGATFKVWLPAAQEPAV